MPEVSQRGTVMPSSPIRRLVPLANAAKARGVKVYHLNIGQPDLATPEIGLEALKKSTERFSNTVPRKASFPSAKSYATTTTNIILR